MTLITLRELLEDAWDIETTYSVEDYLLQDKAWGQCAVTACVVQDFFGGDLYAGKAVYDEHKTSHYWNSIGRFCQDPLDVDLTWRQFPAGTKLTHIHKVDRKKLLQNAWMRQRYKLLSSRVNDINKLLNNE